MTKNIKLELFFALTLAFVSSMEKSDEPPEEFHLRFASGEEACLAIQLPKDGELLRKLNALPNNKTIPEPLKSQLFHLSDIRKNDKYKSDGSTKLAKGADGAIVVLIDLKEYTSFRVEKIIPEGYIEVEMIGESLPEGTPKGLRLHIYFDRTQPTTLRYLHSIIEGHLDSISELISKGLNPIFKVNFGRNFEDSKDTFIMPTTIQALEEIFRNMKIHTSSGQPTAYYLQDMPESLKPMIIPYYDYIKNALRHDSIMIKETEYVMFNIIDSKLNCFDRLEMPALVQVLAHELSGKCVGISINDRDADIIGPDEKAYYVPVNAGTVAILKENEAKMTLDGKLYQTLLDLGLPLEPMVT